MEKVEHAKIRCWNKTNQKLKWRLALRIASIPSERWSVKAAEWNPELSKKQSNWETKEEDGKTTSTNSSNLKRMRPKTLLKATNNTIMGQSSKRPWKKDSTRKRIHNDCGRKI